MDELIDFGRVVEQTRHGGLPGIYIDPERGNCTDHDEDEPGCPFFPIED